MLEEYRIDLTLRIREITITCRYIHRYHILSEESNPESFRYSYGDIIESYRHIIMT